MLFASVESPADSWFCLAAVESMLLRARAPGQFFQLFVNITIFRINRLEIEQYFLGLGVFATLTVRHRNSVKAALRFIGRRLLAQNRKVQVQFVFVGDFSLRLGLRRLCHNLLDRRRRGGASGF